MGNYSKGFLVSITGTLEYLDKTLSLELKERTNGENAISLIRSEIDNLRLRLKTKPGKHRFLKVVSSIFAGISILITIILGWEQTMTLVCGWIQRLF